MIITKRTKLSLCQILYELDENITRILIEKHMPYESAFDPRYIDNVILPLPPYLLKRLIDEVVKKNRSLRHGVKPKYIFEQHWEDFKECLLLDGFKIEEDIIRKADPHIEATEPVEDDLIKELQAAHFLETGEVVNHIRASAESFRNPSPNYNSCLMHSRIAIETLVLEIAKHNDGDGKIWGKSLAHLKSKHFLSTKEENAIASTYTLISVGCHAPVGFTEEEFVRFGRNLVMSMCYLVIKKFNGRSTD